MKVDFHRNCQRQGRAKDRGSIFCIAFRGINRQLVNLCVALIVYAGREGHLARIQPECAKRTLQGSNAMPFAIAGPQVVQGQHAYRQGKQTLVSNDEPIMAPDARSLRTLQRSLRPRKVDLGSYGCVRCFLEVAPLKEVQKILRSLYGHK